MNYASTNTYETCSHKDPKKQWQGTVNRAQGKTFEDLIDISCKHYINTGIAIIEKTPEPMKVLRAFSRESGQFVACYEKKAQPDYKGTLKNGKSVIFEAKHTSIDKMTQSRVTPEQTESLKRYSKMGADCFVIISFEMTEYFRLPWDTWCNMKSRYGRQYVRPNDISEYKVPLSAGGVLLFLDKYF